MQRTIQKPAEAWGIGLHSGNPVQLALRPAPVDSGIVFTRTDLPGQPAIRVSHEAVHETTLSTTMEGPDGFKVATVEHLMSALYGMGIDNLYVELNAPEVPVFDGSAAPYMYLLEEAGIMLQERPKKLIKVMREVRVEDGPKWAMLKPDDRFSLTVGIDFGHPLIPHQQQRFEVTSELYRRGIARARTFCFQDDVEKMQSYGLAKGGGLDNAVVVGDFSVLNPEGLRFKDEFIRHKTLDCIGDLYMNGYPIVGAFEAHMPGHGLNNQLLRTLLGDPLNWRFIEAPADSDILPLSA